MKHITSKLLSLLLCLAMLMSMVPVAYADDTESETTLATAEETATGSGTEADPYVVNTQEQLDSVLSGTLSTTVENPTYIKLGAGEFTTYGKTATQGKSLVFIGNPEGETTWKYGKTPHASGNGSDGNGNGDYSFDGSTVSFSHINFVDNWSEDADYRGFVRLVNAKFDSCKFNNRITYWGTNPTFTDCEFTSSAYVMWMGTDASFTGCTFTSTAGKFINAYDDGSSNNTYNLEFNNCSFISGSEGEPVNKYPAVILKGHNSNAWMLSFNNTTINTTSAQYGNIVTGSQLYGINDPLPATTVTIDGKVVWENGAKVDASAGVIADGVTADNGTVTATVTGTPAAGDKTIEVDATVSNAATEIKSAAVTVSNATLAAVAGKNEVVITTDVGTLSIQSEALSVMKNAAGDAAVTLKIEKVEPAAGENFKVKYELTAKAGETDVFTNENGSGAVTVTVPYTLTNENATPVVYYVDGTNTTKMDATYDKDARKLSWSTQHFSTYAVKEEAAEPTDSIDLDAFLKWLKASNYNVDGAHYTNASAVVEGKLIVKWSPEDGSYYTNGGTHTCPAVNTTATGNTPQRVNNGLTQFHILKDGTANVSVSNVKFVYVPAEFTFCTNAVNSEGQYHGTISAEAAPAGQLYFMTTGDVTFQNCDFEKTVLTTFNTTGKTVVSGCSFKDVYNNYAIKDIRGENVTVTGTTIKNCSGGIMISSTSVVEAVDISNNVFTNVDAAGTAPDDKVGTRAIIQIANSGTYTDTTFDLSSNSATGCGPVIRQLNKTATEKVEQQKTTLETLGTTLYTSDSKAIAKVGETKYYSLEAALAAVTADNALTEVSEEAWPTSTPVYYNGKFYSGTNEVITAKGALEHAIDAANEANSGDIAKIYVRPDYDKDGSAEDLVKQAHQPILTSIAIYGNNASLHYNWQPYSDHDGSDGGAWTPVQKNISVAMYNLHDGAGFWGIRSNIHTINVTMENCKNVHEIML